MSRASIGFAMNGTDDAPLPEEIRPVTDTTTAPVESKPKRRRKAKRAPDPSAPKRTRTTLLSRIEAMGPTHLAAYRTLAQGNPAFAREVAASLEASSAVTRAAMRRARAEIELDAANAAFVVAAERAKDAEAVLSRLDTLAGQIAAARGETAKASTAGA